MNEWVLAFWYFYPVGFQSAIMLSYTPTICGQGTRASNLTSAFVIQPHDCRPPGYVALEFRSTPCSYRITHRRRALPTVPGPRVRRHHSGPDGKSPFTREEPADRGFRVILARLAGRTQSVKGGTWTVVTTLLSSLLLWAVHISGLVRVTPYSPPYHGLGYAARCCTGTCTCSSNRVNCVQRI